MNESTSWNPAEDGPKVTVEFILPHHEEQFEDFRKAASIKNLLWELSNDLRSCIKHNADFNGMAMDESKVDLAEKIREWIHEEAHNKGINID